MQRGEHRAVKHVMSVQHRNPVAPVALVALLRIYRSGEAVILVDIVIQIEIIILSALQNGIIHLGLGNSNPCIDFGIHIHQ